MNKTYEDLINIKSEITNILDIQKEDFDLLKKRIQEIN